MDSLVREAEEFSGVAAAEAELGEGPDGLDGLLLGLGTGPIGCRAGTGDVVGDRSEGAGEPVADLQLGGRNVEPKRQGFADATLGLAEAAAVGPGSRRRP